MGRAIRGDDMAVFLHPDSSTTVRVFPRGRFPFIVADAEKDGRGPRIVLARSFRIYRVVAE
jgi:hypothetical protein